MISGIVARAKRALARARSGNDGFEAHFNVPIKFRRGRPAAVNERIVENAFCLGVVGASERRLRILDFGCTRSWLSISLSAMGHDVLGVDLRPFEFEHARFRFRQANIMDLPEEDGFDVAIALSTLEHVGLGVYGADAGREDLEGVLAKIARLVRPDGRFILTCPVGIPSTDHFERSFAPEEIKGLVGRSGFHLLEQRYFRRDGPTEWSPSPEERMATVRNDIDARSRAGSGVNGVGCFVFRREAETADEVPER